MLTEAGSTAHKSETENSTRGAMPSRLDESRLGEEVFFSCALWPLCGSNYRLSPLEVPPLFYSK